MAWKRTLRWHLASALAAIVLGAAAQHAAAADLTTWKHGIVAAKSDAGFAFMAANHGFAEKQGLKIEMIQFKGDALALRAMLAGELDSYDGNPGGPMLGATHGADVKITGCYWPALTYDLFSKGTVTLDTLKGKTFGVSSPGSLPDLLARAVLEQHDVPASEARFAVLGSDSDRYQALLAGVIDVAGASAEFTPLAERQGLKLLVRGQDAVPNYLRFCTYMAGKTIAAKHDAAARFLAADIEGLRYALAHRDEELKLTQEVTDTKPDDPRPAYIFDEVKRYDAIDPEMPIPLDKLQWMQDLLIKTGNLEKKIDLTTMIDPSVRTAALAIAGK